MVRQKWRSTVVFQDSGDKCLQRPVRFDWMIRLDARNRANLLSSSGIDVAFSTVHVAGLQMVRVAGLPISERRGATVLPSRRCSVTLRQVQGQGVGCDTRSHWCGITDEVGGVKTHGASSVRWDRLSKAVSRLLLGLPSPFA